MARLAAVVAATAGGRATQAEGRAVRLDMAETLAMIALLGLSGAWEGAPIGLVAWLLACMSVLARAGCQPVRAKHIQL